MFYCIFEFVIFGFLVWVFLIEVGCSWNKKRRFSRDYSGEFWGGGVFRWE